MLQVTPNDQDTLSRSHATTIAYAARVHGLAVRCRAELGLWEAEPLMSGDLVAWLIAQKTGWAPTTWRLYKAAVAAELDEAIRRGLAPTSESAGATLEDDELTELQEARHRLDVESQAGCVKKSTRTSAQKLKRLPPAERRRICNELSKASARYGPVLADCLEAGALTGLRPCEWPSVMILPGTGTGALALLVTNAKQGPHRAHGPTRTLTFEKLQDQKRAALRRWLAIVAACDAPTYRRLLSRLSDLLYRTTRALWPRRRRHPTLYSARHEAAAMFKIVYPPEDVAAMMGHATDVTASAHYGRCRPGKQGLPPDVREALSNLPRPAPTEVLRVRRLLTDQRARLPRRDRGPGPRS